MLTMSPSVPKVCASVVDLCMEGFHSAVLLTEWATYGRFSSFQDVCNEPVQSAVFFLFYFSTANTVNKWADLIKTMLTKIHQIKICYITNVNTHTNAHTKRYLNWSCIGFIAKAIPKDCFENNFSVLPHRCYTPMKIIPLSFPTH